MKIKVEHHIASDPIYCRDGDSGGWYNCCPYGKLRDRHGKRGTPIQRTLPRCALFGDWLEQEPVFGPKKCDECLAAVREAEVAP